MQITFVGESSLIFKHVLLRKSGDMHVYRADMNGKWNECFDADKLHRN